MRIATSTCCGLDSCPLLAFKTAYAAGVEAAPTQDMPTATSAAAVGLFKYCRFQCPCTANSFITASGTTRTTRAGSAAGSTPLQLAALLSKFLRPPLAVPRWPARSGHDGSIPRVETPPRRIVRRVQSLRDLHVSLNWVEDGERICFSAPAELKGRRVLLIDDTFTQGGSITAAHEALVAVGARVMVPLVIGRHFRPEFSTSKPLYECLSRHRWRLKRCGICKPVECPEIAGPATLL